MSATFKQYLADSIAITGNLAKELHSDTLKDTKEWETINSKDSAFAKKLLTAWEGDVRDYEKNRFGDPLFTKMVQPASVEKLSNIKLDGPLKDVFKKLDMLFYKAMPKHAKPAVQNKDVWWHERHVRELDESFIMEAGTLFDVGDMVETTDDSVTRIRGKITHVFTKGSKVPAGITAYTAYDKLGGKMKPEVQQEHTNYTNCYVIDAAPVGETKTVPIWVTLYKFVKVKKLK